MAVALHVDWACLLVHPAPPPLLSQPLTFVVSPQVSYRTSNLPKRDFSYFSDVSLRIRLRIFETDVYTHTYTKLHQRQRRPQTVGEITHVLFSLPAGTLPYRKKKPATMLEHWAVLSSEWVKCCMLNAKEQWWHKIGHLWNHRLQIVQSMTTEKIFSDHARQNLSDTTTRLDLSQWH